MLRIEIIASEFWINDFLFEKIFGSEILNFFKVKQE